MKVDFKDEIVLGEYQVVIIPFVIVEDERFRASYDALRPSHGLPALEEMDTGNNAFFKSYPIHSEAPVIYFVKVRPDHAPSHWKKLSADLFFKHTKSDGERILISLKVIEKNFKKRQLVSFIACFVFGASLGYYDIGLYKKQARRDSRPSIIDVSVSKLRTKDIDKLSRILPAVSEVSFGIMDLVNAPANHKSPQVFIDFAKSQCDDDSVSCQAFYTDELERMGLHALLSVSKGSTNPPAMLVIHYKPVEVPCPRVALVGKGVTFDTGGLSIKGSQNMHYMKSDMGGAAAVLGATLAAIKLDVPVELITVVPLTENSVDGESTKPGDVIKSYHGSTIEVIDTDAEGRLILADALAYAVKNYEPDYLIDLATLTGSIVRALGNHAAGLMTDNDKLASSLLKAGDSIGERLWRMPLWKEYREMMDSDIADIKNLSEKPVAGAITAATFLKHFTDDHGAWAHIDIAGMAFGSNPLSKSYSATGYGLYLITEWLYDLN